MNAARTCARLAAVACLALACRDEAPRPVAPEARRYTVRGEVVRLPGDGQPELLVRHEPIPDFADRTGATVGMAAMTMPFPVDRGVSLDGVAPGDKVRLRFRMDWARNDLAVEEIAELPPGTALELGPRPPER
jgi:Cu/Ag efflux protein CusF